MELETITTYIMMFFTFLLVVITLGQIFPDYFGESANLLLDNIGAFMLLMAFSLIIYLLAKKK